DFGIAHHDKGPVLGVARRGRANGGVEDLRDEIVGNGIGLEAPQGPRGVDRLEEAELDHDILRPLSSGVYTLASIRLLAGRARARRGPIARGARLRRFAAGAMVAVGISASPAAIRAAPEELDDLARMRLAAHHLAGAQEASGLFAFDM